LGLVCHGGEDLLNSSYLEFGWKLLGALLALSHQQCLILEFRVRGKIENDCNGTWGCSSVVECLPSMSEALGLVPQSTHTHTHTWGGGLSCGLIQACNLK
ncbi:hypothetical protein LEMLEM_LOCUS26397, partial [Lemmus lemmus]